jgi:putative FmdB family regulatory protein
MVTMPVYEYEPTGHECFMCEGRVAVIQGVDEEALKFCPQCGLDVRRVISKASIKIAGKPTEDRASRKGFSTFRKSEAGVWEKTAGEGPDMIVGSKEDVNAVEQEKAERRKIIDLDP